MNRYSRNIWCVLNSQCDCVGTHQAALVRQGFWLAHVHGLSRRLQQRTARQQSPSDVPKRVSPALHNGTQFHWYVLRYDNRYVTVSAIILIDLARHPRRLTTPYQRTQVQRCFCKLQPPRCFAPSLYSSRSGKLAPPTHAPVVRSHLSLWSLRAPVDLAIAPRTSRTVRSRPFPPMLRLSEPTWSQSRQLQFRC